MQEEDQRMLENLVNRAREIMHNEVTFKTVFEKKLERRI